MDVLDFVTFKEGRSRYLGNWNRFLSHLSARQTGWIQRYKLSHTHSDKTFRFIRSLLIGMGDDLLLKEEDWFTVYNSHILSDVKIARAKFDPINVGLRGPFFTNAACSEVIIPTSCNLAIGELTFDDPWSEWMMAKPITLMSHDSLDLSFEYTNSDIKFNGTPPTFMVYGINTPMLLIMYLKYLRNKGITTFEENHVDEFITYYIMPRIWEDYANAWTLNIVLNYLDGDDESSISPPRRESIDSSLKTNVVDVTKLIDDVTSHKISIEDFLSNDILLNGSIYDYIDDIKEYHKLPKSTRYSGYVFLAYKPIVDILSSVASKRSNSNKDSKIIRDAEQLVRHLSRVSWKSHIKDLNTLRSVAESIGDLTNVSNI